MAPYTRAAMPLSVAIRMRALQMKRACKKVSITTTVKEALTWNQQVVSPNKSPKKPELKYMGKKTKLKQSVTGKSKASKSISNSNSKSEKLSKSSKSTTVDEEEDEDSTGGLKLLKRGMVTMNRITRGLVRKRKRIVKFNTKGVPVGPAAIHMQSY